MTVPANEERSYDPEGSIFLFEPLNESEYQKRYFALKMGRDAYRGLEFDEQEEIHRELLLRRSLTRRMGDTAISSTV